MKRQQVDQVEGMFAAGARQNASTPPASGNSNDQQTQSSLASVQNNGLDLSVDSQGNTMNHSVDTKEPFSIRAQLSNVLDNNPYFSAGFGLMGVGAALAVLRRSALQAATLARRRLLVSLEISSKDPSYLWFLQWMSEHSAKSSSLPGLAGKIRSHELAVETIKEQRNDGSSKTTFSLVPGPGTHYFKFQNTWFQVQRERDGKMMDLTSGTPWETVKLTTLSRDRRYFPALLSEAQELAKASQVGKMIIYTAWGPEWRPFGQPRAKRLLDSVILDKGVKERILSDVEQFMGRGKWYAERGIPYRRGVLLYGPPGSGKSSFIQALAGSLDYNICILNLSERGLTDDKLNHLMINAPERSFILLEDVDAAFSGRTSTDETGFSANVTFSGLLNAVDGVASSTSQRILFMTTNHISKLDPALIRPGRVDLKEYIGDATPSQACALFKRFYSDSVSDSELERMLQRLAEKMEDTNSKGRPLSMASLQGHFIRNNAQDALDHLQTLIHDAMMDRTAHESSATRYRVASSP